MRYPAGSTIEEKRVNVCRRMVNGVEMFDANIRGSYAHRTWLGRYATRDEAEAVAERFIATGVKPMRRKTGPSGPLKQPRKAVTSAERQKPVAVPQRAAAERLEMIRRVYCERMMA